MSSGLWTNHLNGFCVQLRIVLLELVESFVLRSECSLNLIHLNEMLLRLVAVPFSLEKEDLFGLGGLFFLGVE